MKTLLALVLLLLPTMLHAASSATVNGEVLVAPTNLVLRSVDPAKGTLRIILPAGMYTNGFAVYDSSSNLLFGVTSNGAFQAFSPWSVLGSSTNLMTGTNLPGADGDVLTKGPTGLFMATPTGGGGGSSTNGLATTNYVNAGDTATSNHLESAKQPASLTLTNLSNTGAITNVSDAGNAFISWIYTSNNFTILLKTTSAGANLWVTNNGTNIVIAGPSTNGFVTQIITNGLATISYVNGATQGLVTASVTNGLATISYVDTKLNSTSNSLLSQIISSQVWTNDGQFIYWRGQPAVAPNSATPGPMFFFSTNGSIFIGQNVNQDVNASDASARRYYDVSFTASNEPAHLSFQQFVGDSEDYNFWSTWYFDLEADKDIPTAELSIGANGTNGVTDRIILFADPGYGFGGSYMTILNAGNYVTTLKPGAANDGTVPYVFDTELAHTSGNLLEVKNQGATKLKVQYNGLHYGAAGNGITFQDTASTGGLQLFADDVGRPMMRFDTAGGIELSLQTKNRLARLNAQTNLVSSSYDETDFALASTTNLFSTIVNLNAASNAIVNIATNTVRVAPGAGTSVATNYENGGVTYVVSDSEVASTMVKTNFVLNQVYTNTSVQPVLIKADTFMITAAVSGDCAVDLMYSPLGATSYALLSRVAIATTVAGGLALPITNTIVGVVTNLGSYYFTNTSSGIGNTAGLVGAGTGQYVIIGGGAQGPTGAAGTSGTSGITNFQFGVNIDGAGAPIATGLKNSFIYIDKPTTLHQWFIVTDVASTVTVDVYKTNFTQGVNGFRPGSGLTICGGNKPSTTSLFSSNNALTSWTVTTLVSNDVLFFNVDSATSATYAKIWLQATSP